MKKTKKILLVIIVGVFCAVSGVVAGMYIGITHHDKNNINSLIETMTMEQSRQLFKKCMYLKGLQNGHTRNVMDLLSAEIKAGLEAGPLMDVDDLSDIHRKTVINNRHEAGQILKDYQNFVKDENN